MKKKQYEHHFQQLISYFKKSIWMECKKYQSVLSMDDLYASALIGLYYADITYECGACSFEDYVLATIRKTMKLCYSKNFYPLKYKSLSENSGSKEYNPEIASILRIPEVDWDMQIMVKEYLASLEPETRQVALYISQDYSLEEIADYCNMTQASLAKEFLNLRQRWQCMYGKSYH